MEVNLVPRARVTLIQQARRKERREPGEKGMGLSSRKQMGREPTKKWGEKEGKVNELEKKEKKNV